MWFVIGWFQNKNGTDLHFKSVANDGVITYLPHDQRIITTGYIPLIEATIVAIQMLLHNKYCPGLV